MRTWKNKVQHWTAYQGIAAKPWPWLSICNRSPSLISATERHTRTFIQSHRLCDIPLLSLILYPISGIASQFSDKSFIRFHVWYLATYLPTKRVYTVTHKYQGHLSWTTATKAATMNDTFCILTQTWPRLSMRYLWYQEREINITIQMFNDIPGHPYRAIVWAISPLLSLILSPISGILSLFSSKSSLDKMVPCMKSCYTSTDICSLVVNTLPQLSWTTTQQQR